jgi:hypothetical protein
MYKLENVSFSTSKSLPLDETSSELLTIKIFITASSYVPELIYEP